MFAVLNAQGQLQEVFSDLERAEGHAQRAAQRNNQTVLLDPNCAVAASTNEVPVPLVSNPALPNVSAVFRSMSPPEQAYYRTRLPEICEILYGKPYLTSEEVLSLSLPAALEKIRTSLPASKSYDNPTEAASLLLKVNAKLQHSPVIDATKYISKGLALVPHQLGMRVPEARNLNQMPDEAGPPGLARVSLERCHHLVCVLDQGVSGVLLGDVRPERGAASR